MIFSPFARLPRFHSANTFSCQRNLLTGPNFAIPTVEDEPKPFVWVKTADEILESVRRFFPAHFRVSNRVESQGGR